MARKDDGKGGKGQRKPDAKESDKAPSGSGGSSNIVYLGIIGLCLALIGSFAWTTFNGGSGSRSKGASKQSALNVGGTVEFIGNKTLYPSFGLFPRGCKWRPVAEKGKSGFDYVWCAS